MKHILKTKILRSKDTFLERNLCFGAVVYPMQTEPKKWKFYKENSKIHVLHET